MGHGTINYQGGMIINSHEGIAGEIGKQLKQLAERPQYCAIQSAVRRWQSDLEMPTGCSAIQLDNVLSEEGVKALFIDALTKLQGEIGDNKPRTLQLIRQVILLLTVGEQGLEEGYRPVRQT